MFRSLPVTLCPLALLSAFLSLPPSHSLSLSLCVSVSVTFIWVLLSEGHTVNPNINNEWNRVGATCVRLIVPDWWEVMTASSALPSSIMLSFRALWLSTLSLKLWNTHRSPSSFVLVQSLLNWGLCFKRAVFFPHCSFCTDVNMLNEAETQIYNVGLIILCKTDSEEEFFLNMYTSYTASGAGGKGVWGFICETSNQDCLMTWRVLRCLTLNLRVKTRFKLKFSLTTFSFSVVLVHECVNVNKKEKKSAV